MDKRNFFCASAALYENQAERTGDTLDRREGQPDARDAENGAQREQQGRNGDDAAHERHGEAAPRLTGRAEIRRRDDVDAGREKAGEVDAQTGHRVGGERRVVLAVECRRNGRGEQKHENVHRKRERKRGHDRPAEQTAAVGACAAADERLHAGGQAGEDGALDECEVRDDAVGGDAGVACKAQQHQIEQQQRDAGGNLTDERGQAGRTDARQQAEFRLSAPQMEAASRLAQVAGEHEQTDERGSAGGERRAEHTESAWENKDPVEHDVEQAAGDHAGHGAAGVAVVAHKGEHDIVRDEKGREAQQQPQIDRRHFERFAVRAEQPRQRDNAENAGEHEQHGNHKAERKRMGKRAVGLGVVALRPAERVVRRTAHADHQAETVHQVVRRDGDVERGKTERTGALGDEKGIRENVARNADHAKNARRGVAAEFAERRGVFQNITPSEKKKRLPLHLQRPAMEGGRPMLLSGDRGCVSLYGNTA